MSTQRQPRNYKMEFNETIKVRDIFEAKAFPANSKKFISHILSGWFPSRRVDLSPEGVFKERIIDRKKNFYKEKVVDAKDNHIIRDIEEDLTNHR